MSAPVFIGIDLGSTFVKGALLNIASNTLTHIERLPTPTPISGLPARQFEVDPNQIVETTRALLQRLAAHHSAHGRIAGVVMCSQMHGLVLMNEHGAALSNAITWQDERTLDAFPDSRQPESSYFDTLRARLPETAAAELGNELMPGRPLCALFWLRERGQLPAHAIAASLPDFVIARLSGALPSTHPSNASGHALFDVHAGGWHRGLLEKLGLGDVRLPVLAGDFDRPAGSILLNGHPTPLFAALGDQQAALLGAGLQHNELSINISTGSQVSVLFARPPLAQSSAQTRPYPGGHTLQTITHIPAGRALNTLVTLFCELAARAGHPVNAPWALIAEAVDAAADTALAVDLSFFGGAARSKQAGGHIQNIREGEFSIGTLMRAAFTSMAQNYAAAHAQLSRQTEIERVVLSGGIAQQFPALRAAIQRAVPLPQRLCEHTEDTLMGLLRYAQAADASPRAPVTE